MNTKVNSSKGIILLRAFFCLIFSLSTLAFAQEIKLKPENLFANLALATNGLDFPSSLETLTACRKANDSSCLKTFELAMEAKKNLQQSVSKVNLAKIFSVINSACRPVGTPSDSLACNGALISLFFYNNETFDEIIFAKIQSMSCAERSFIFGNYYHWYGNRPLPRKWIDYIKSANIEWVTPESKQLTLEYFSNPKELPYWITL